MKYQPFIDGITIFDLEPFQREEYQKEFLTLVKNKIYPLGDGDTETAFTLTGNEKVVIEVIAGIIAAKLDADKRRGRPKAKVRTKAALKQERYRLNKKTKAD